MATNQILTALANEPGDRKTQWLRVQELAQQWRETGDLNLKTQAADLLVKLMASDALVKIKKMRVDADLPARLRRDYEDMATGVVASVLANPNTRATAILENHDPEQALMRTMVNFYLRNKIFDHLRDQPVEGVFRTVARTSKAKPGGALPHAQAAANEVDATPDVPIDETPDSLDATLPDGDSQYARHTRRYQPSSMLADDAPGALPQPEADSAWDTAHETRQDLIKILAALLEPDEQEAVYYDLAGYTIDEARSAIGVAESTYRRRLKSANAKFTAYHALGE